MLTRRLIVMVVIMFVGLTALVISYRWHQPRVKKADDDGVQKGVIDPREAGIRAVRRLAEEGVRLQDHFREIGPDDFAKRSQGSVVQVEFLSVDQFTVESISLLHELPGLKTVSFYDTPFTDKHAALAVELTNIRELNLNYTDVTDAGLAKLVSVLNLSILRLNGTQVTDQGLTYLLESKIRVLSLYGTAVTDNGLERLAQMPELAFLDVQKSNVTPEGVSRFRERKAKCVVYFDPY